MERLFQRLRIPYRNIINNKIAPEDRGKQAQTNNSEYMLRYRSGLRHICFRKASIKRHVSATRWLQFTASVLGEIMECTEPARRIARP